MGIFLIFLLIAIIAIVIANIKIVPQAHEYVIEFLGKYKTTWGAGFHIKWPVLEVVANRVTLKEQVLDSPPQPVITKDNVTMQIDTVIYYAIYNSKLYAYGAVNPISALSNLAATTLRNIVGELELDGTLTSRDTINAKMTEILDEATDKWGIKVNRVELKNIIPPTEIQNAMEKHKRSRAELSGAEINGICARFDGGVQRFGTACRGEQFGERGMGGIFYHFFVHLLQIHGKFDIIHI